MTSRGVHMIILLASFLECGLAVDYVNLEEDALYEFSWAGPSTAARAEDIALRTRDDGTLPYIQQFTLHNTHCIQVMT